MGISIIGYRYQCDYEGARCLIELSAEFKRPRDANDYAIQSGWSIVQGRTICPIHVARGKK